MKRYSKKITSLFLIICLGISGLTMGGCARTPQTISKTGFYFDTVITITLYDDRYEDLLDGCFELAGKYEKLFSKTVADSDVSRINENAGQPVTVDAETVALINKGIYYGDLSGGSFDITVGALSALWDFSNNDDTVPAEADIAAAVATINYKDITVDGNEVTLNNPKAQLDLGGIAKGYIADQMKSYLTSNGVEHGLINLGGNVLVLGTKTDGDAYNIAIQKPFSDEGEAITSVKIKDQTVVSSGVYERYFYVGDTLYHHILDPHTGYPYDNQLLSVSIICDNSVDGDGLSTTCFSLGLEDGMALIERLDNTEAIFITDDYELHTSSGVELDN